MTMMERMDALEKRMRELADRMAAFDEAIITAGSDPDGFTEAARPEPDDSARERAGEDRSKPPPGMMLLGLDGGSWSWNVDDPRTDTDVMHTTREGALRDAWTHYDRLTAPLRAECEQLKAEIARLNREENTLQGPYSRVCTIAAEQRERADAAEAEAERHATKSGERLTRIRALEERAEKAERERDEVKAREAKGVEVFDGIVAEQRDTIERLTRDQANARRSVIEELVREAERENDAAMLRSDMFAATRWTASARWLRPKLDHTPTEQPTPDAPSEPAPEEKEVPPWTRGPCYECGCEMEYARTQPARGPFFCEACEMYGRGYKDGAEVGAKAIDAAREEGRREMQGRCAKVAEDFRDECCTKNNTAPTENARQNWGVRAQACSTIAWRIRNLPTQPSSTPTPTEGA
jgi:DNA repair exonuclease SbcCD ATPase subunit